MIFYHRVMDAQPETVEGDRLDVLTKLVEAWEEEHFPIGEPETKLPALRQSRLFSQGVAG